MTHSPSEPLPGDGRYAAFISYSHVDRKIARWLHRALEGYRIPHNLVNHANSPLGARSRLAPVFLDREELATNPDLGATIRAALQQSLHLIVICSPAAAQSRWVDAEVRSFQALGRSARILCLIVDGVPHARERNAPAELECFPPALRGQSTVEPLAADIRRGSDSRRMALLKLVAGLLGASLDDIRQRDLARRQRRLVLLSTGASLGCLVLAGLAAVAWRARNEAVRERGIAVQKSLTAERTANFLVSLFEVVDPSEARGNTVTAREILDRGALQVDTSLRDEPQVHAELLTTLGRVYQGLGLYDSSFALLSKARTIPAQRAIEWIRETNALAYLELMRGNIDRCDQLFESAYQEYRLAGVQEPAVEADILMGLGGAAAKLDHTDQARQRFQEAIDVSTRNHLTETRVRALEGIAMTDFYAGDNARAEQSYAQALKERIALSGESHPKAAESINGLAAIAYLRGDNARAEANWAKLAEIERHLLGSKHPELAATLNNLGRARLERREFKLAIENLSEAVAIKSAQQNANDSDMAFVLTNLALAHAGLHEYPQAEPLLERALSVAQVNRLPLQGPIMGYLADVQCRTQRVPQGLKHLDAAQPLVAARYPDDAWRLALLDNVRANCLTAQRHYREAEPLITTSTPLVLKKWHANTIFGHDALSNATHLFQLTGNAARLSEYQQFMASP